MIDKTQNLIKQIHDCCAWFPASKALSAVPVDIQLQAATKVGLVKQGAIKFCSDRIEYFLAECFMLLSTACTTTTAYRTGLVQGN